MKKCKIFYLHIILLSAVNINLEKILKVRVEENQKKGIKLSEAFTFWRLPSYSCSKYKNYKNLISEIAALYEKLDLKINYKNRFYVYHRNRKFDY